MIERFNLNDRCETVRYYYFGSEWNAMVIKEYITFLKTPRPLDGILSYLETHWEVLPICRRPVGVFYGPRQQDKYQAKAAFIIECKQPSLWFKLVWPNLFLRKITIIPPAHQKKRVISTQFQLVHLLKVFFFMNIHLYWYKII